MLLLESPKVKALDTDGRIGNGCNGKTDADQIPIDDTFPQVIIADKYATETPTNDQDTGFSHN